MENQMAIASGDGGASLRYHALISERNHAWDFIALHLGKNPAFQEGVDRAHEKLAGLDLAAGLEGVKVIPKSSKNFLARTFNYRSAGSETEADRARAFALTHLEKVIREGCQAFMADKNSGYNGLAKTIKFSGIENVMDALKYIDHLKEEDLKNLGYKTYGGVMAQTLKDLGQLNTRGVWQSQLDSHNLFMDGNLENVWPHFAEPYFIIKGKFKAETSSLSKGDSAYAANAFYQYCGKISPKVGEAFHLDYGHKRNIAGLRFYQTLES
jgi:hypothetical protein